MMIYAIVGIVVLVLVFLIVRNLNLPKTLEQRRLAAQEKSLRDEARDKARAEKRANREPIFPWRRKKKELPPPTPIKPVEK